MRFLLDAQLPPALGRWLEGRGHEAEHVREVLGPEATDGEIAKHATHGELILLSKDADFVEEQRRSAFVLVWLRCGNLINRRLIAWLEPRWSAIEHRLAAGDLLVEVR